MKKISLKVAACFLAATFLFSSCFVGKYGLWNKYINWQNHMTSSKFVNAIVGFFLVPIVGGICQFVDILVLNTIEFWSGSNPVASNIGTTKQVLGQDGRYYAAAPAGQESMAISAMNRKSNDNEPNKTPITWNTSARLTKELGRMGGLSVYVNNALFYEPFLQGNKTTTLSQRNTGTFSFGAELYLNL